MNWIKASGYLLVFLIFITSIEILSFSVIYFLQNKYHTLKFDAELITNFEAVASANYSNDLGWITPIEERDEIGARINDDIYESNCIDMFGDSFTFSTEVTSEFAWPKQLSKIIGCKVNNFGVGGYGSDQATLRHDLTPAFSKVAVLNHLSENITRNVNQFRNLLYPGSSLKLKPRYIVNSDSELKLIKKPELVDTDLKSLKSLTYKLKYEYFIPEGSSGIKWNLKFPYFLSAIDLITNHFHINSKIRGITRHSDFYTRTHPSNALVLTNKIFERFVSNSVTKGQTPIITIIPTCRDLEEFKRYGSLPYQEMIEDLKAKDVLFYDFSSAFLAKDDFTKYFNLCSAHPNKEGYALMAKNFAMFLSRNKNSLATYIPTLIEK